MTVPTMCPFSIKNVMTTVGVLVLTSSLLTDACFIRNCPRGGKRSLDTGTLGQRQCQPCGVDGQCVGPSICCSPYSGCSMGTLETDICQQENLRTTPCEVQGEPCGYQNEGNCVADGICCDSDSCALNKKCRLPELKGARVAIDESSASRGDLLTLLQSLLRSKTNE